MSDTEGSANLKSAGPVRVVPGSFEEALQHGRMLLAEHPAAALRQAETLLRAGPEPRALRLAAAACRSLGRSRDAEAAELAAIQASFKNTDLERVALATAEGDNPHALKMAKRFLRDNADDLLALTLAAEAAMNLWDLEEAEQMLRVVLERAPSFLRASILLATCLSKDVRMREATATLKEVTARRPDNAQALTLLAQLSSEVRDNDEAVRIHERLANLEPTRPERWVNLAQHYRIVGRRDDAAAAFRHALEIEPRSGSAWWGLTNYFPDEIKEGDEEAIRAAIPETAGKIDEGALHLALGLIADRSGQRSEAFEHFIAGKALRLAKQPYDPAPISAAVDDVIGTFTADFYERRKSSGWRDSSPIFIIGMPRSGTTMVEQMLGRHSAIEAAGELQIMQRLAESGRHKADNPQNYAGLLESLPDEELSNTGKRYMDASRDYRHTSKPRFIDKNNLNWMHIALVLLALPDAKVIDVRRNPLDCCWANFKMLFADRFPAANDLSHVGRFYRDYVRLVDAMSSAAKGRILTIRYEDVVDDIEGHARRMLEFVGLDYETQCLDFHLATGAVATASSEQVRRPLNRKGIGSAEPYRQWLDPLISELGPLATQ